MSPSTPSLGRRDLLRAGAGAAALAALGPFEALGARSAGAAPLSKQPSSTDYGALRPVKDQTTGLELLALPKGFEYLTYGWTGDVMANGQQTLTSVVLSGGPRTFGDLDPISASEVLADLTSLTS